jgi:phosphate transport system substrate-binding protein
MRSSFFPGSLAGWLFLATALSAPAAESLRLIVTPSLGQVMAAVIPAMRDVGVEAKIKSEAGSSVALQLMAAEEADAAFTVKPLSGEDRSLAPERPFVEIRIATQATAVLVSRDVWEGGVKSLSKEQLRQIYEKEVTSWKQVGGADRPIKFFNYERGQGIWEQFVTWIYGEIRKAPLGKWDIVVTGEDARNTVEFNGGSMALASPRWADGKEVFAVGLSPETGAAVPPTPEHLADRSYPLVRPVLAVFPEKPTGARLRMLDFLRSPKCQELLRKGGLIPEGEIPAR